jgi:hypothetical protein
MIEGVACAISPREQSGVLDAIKSALAISDDLAVREAIREFRGSIALKPFPSVERLSQMQRMMAAPRPAVTALRIQDLVDERLLQELDNSGFIDVTYSSYGVV